MSERVFIYHRLIHQYLSYHFNNCTENIVWGSLEATRKTPGSSLCQNAAAEWSSGLFHFPTLTLQFMFPAFIFVLSNPHFGIPSFPITTFSWLRTRCCIFQFRSWTNRSFSRSRTPWRRVLHEVLGKLWNHGQNARWQSVPWEAG